MCIRIYGVECASLVCVGVYWFVLKFLGAYRNTGLYYSLLWFIRKYWVAFFVLRFVGIF